MSIGILFIIVIFVAIVYIYTFLRFKKRRKQLENSKIGFIDSSDRISKTNNTVNSNDLRIDYIEKDQLYKEIQDEIHKNDLTISKKVLKF